MGSVPIGAGSYLLTLQHDLLAHLATVVVAPLFEERDFGTPAGVINPTFVLEGHRVVLSSATLAGISRAALGEEVATLTHERHRVMAALDLLFTGVSPSFGANRRRVRAYSLERSGQNPWKGRLRSCVVQNVTYLRSCQRYIEGNPALAAVVAHPGDYGCRAFARMPGARPTRHDPRTRLTARLGAPSLSAKR